MRMNNSNTITGNQIKNLMRAHNKTIRGLAQSMGITVKRVREVRATGVQGLGFVCDWYEAITGVDLHRQLIVCEGFGLAA